MKKAAVALLCCACSAYAAAGAVLPADLMNQQCLIARVDATDAKANAICTFAIWGFLGGYTAGAEHGVLTAFIEDRENLQTTKGAADLQRRTAAIRQTARCFPADISVAQAMDLFMKHLAAHPEQKVLEATYVLSAALEERFGCK